jgi:ethanolamine ammonia-lyase small subunit
MEEDQLNSMIDAIVKELSAAGLIHAPEPEKQSTQSSLSNSQAKTSELLASFQLDTTDITLTEQRAISGITAPINKDGLAGLMESTSARIGVGRAGPRYCTKAWLLFQADLAITQDTLLRDVDEKLLAELGLFSVQTKISAGKQEYLLRPDLGRQLSDEARRIISEKCIKKPQIQICVGDGLSAEAIEVNLRKILPVIQQGCQSSGLSLGTPFFVKYCRVGVMNDIGDLIQPEVLMLLIGERPGLGRAESMSIYMGYHPQAGHSDAERDVICNIFDHGGTNPLEAGAFSVQFAKRMIKYQASGVKLKMIKE